MANIYDLRSVQIALSGADSGTNLGLGAVPAGKTRYVIGVKIETITLSNMITLGEAAASTGALTTNKLKKKLDGTFVYPANPDINTPIFSIAASLYLGAIGLSGVTDTELTVLYYDE